MKFRPLHNQVVVQTIEAASKTSGGILIPDNVKDKPVEGKVIAVGPGTKDENDNFISLDVAAGDHILFAKYTGTEVKLDGKEYIIMKETDIMGVFEDKSSKAA